MLHCHQRLTAAGLKPDDSKRVCGSRLLGECQLEKRPGQALGATTLSIASSAIRQPLLTLLSSNPADRPFVDEPSGWRKRCAHARLGSGGLLHAARKDPSFGLCGFASS